MQYQKESKLGSRVQLCFYFIFIFSAWLNNRGQQGFPKVSFWPQLWLGEGGGNEAIAASVSLVPTPSCLQPRAHEQCIVGTWMRVTFPYPYKYGYGSYWRYAWKNEPLCFTDLEALRIVRNHLLGLLTTGPKTIVPITLSISWLSDKELDGCVWIIK